MPLLKTTIRDVTGRGAHLFADKAEFLLHSDGVRSITTEDDDASKSFFYYDINGKDGRAGTVRVRSNQTAAVIAGYCEETTLNKFITLSVYKEANSSSSTEEISYKTKDIRLAYDVDAGSIVYVRQGVLLERIMVSEAIVEIIIEAGNTTTTTSTSSTSTTSTSSTSTSTTSTSSTSTTTFGTFDPLYSYGQNGYALVYIVFGPGNEIDSVIDPSKTDLNNHFTVLVNDVPREINSDNIPGDQINSLALFFTGAVLGTGDVIKVSYDWYGDTKLIYNESGEYLSEFTDLTATMTTTTTTTSTTSTSSTSSTTTAVPTTTTTSTSTTAEPTTTTTSTTTTGSGTTTTTTTTLDPDALLNPDGDEVLKDPLTGETLLNPL